MSRRWAIRWTLEGDLRFLSHHDLLRELPRICHRAQLPLRYSQGFNPRPIFSLPAPRPVGVTGLDELLVLETDGEIDPADAQRRLNQQSLQGLRFTRTRPLDGRKAPQPTELHYRLALPDGSTSAITERIERLKREDRWIVHRRRKTKRRRRIPGEEPTKEIDIRPGVRELSAAADQLRFVGVPVDQRWAKPAEVLALLGLDEPQAMVRLVRDRVVFEL